MRFSSPSLQIKPNYGNSLVFTQNVYGFVYIVDLSTFILFLGFSFGGLLASSVSARLFQQPYLTSEQLVGSLLCVTFGHPLLSLREVAKTALQFPLFKSILHCIFMEDDVFPQLMQYTEIEISASDDDTTPEVIDTSLILINT